ncbi:hypothetical protein C1I92_17020 [Jiangella anatolica]|uniref:ABC transporter permease n=1 Tax=Jiangella anatolica TaxID=2670374 RepID=A0A2W2BAV3_9ACTN|nr:hypothetical protein C1I92_17020 [Jiangella anatolica]
MLVGVLVTAFAWPPAESAPRDIPVAVVGSAAAADRFERQLAETQPDALDLRRAADADTARRLIEDREVYGAIVFEPTGTARVLTASAGSPVVAQVLTGIAGQVAEPAAASPPVEDVVPLPDADPRGSAFAAAALPMVLGGMVVGILMSFLVTGVWRRVAGALVAAAAAGGVVTLVAQTWLGALQGSVWANAGAVALIVAAISLTITGLVALLGPAGIGLGAVVMFLVGNSISGVSSAPEFLPTGWGALGQALPAGAGGTLLRSTSYFDGAAAIGPVLVLTAWAVAGLALVALGRRLRPAAHHALAR